jgi:hypothetical protein
MMHLLYKVSILHTSKSDGLFMLRDLFALEGQLQLCLDRPIHDPIALSVHFGDDE